MAAELLEDRTLLASVVWDGGGDGTSWQQDANWVGDAIPLPGDDVLIGSGGTVVFAGPDLSLNSLHIDSTFTVNDGDVTVTGTLDLDGITVNLDGENSSLVSTGEGAIDGTQFFVDGGGHVEIQNVTGVTQPAQQQYLARTRHHGSVFSLPDLTTINGASSGHDMYIQSIAGGQVDLPELETIVTGDVQFYSEGISTVDAAPSVINLPKLATYSAVANQGAYLQAVNQGSINVPLLTNLNEVDLIIKSGVIQTAQLQSITNSVVTLDDASPAFPLITNIDSLQFFLDNGATLTMEGVTSITRPAGNLHLVRTRHHGSVFSLPDLTTINGASSGHDMYIQSIAGGQVDLPELETIVTGDVQFYSEGISTVDAAPSVINLPKLATYSAVANQRAYLQAVNQGSINVPLLTNLNEVDLIIKSGVIQTAQLQSITNSVVTLDDASPAFPLITNIDSLQFFLDNGATLTMEGVTSITRPAGNLHLVRTRHHGSVFSLPDLTTINGASSGHDMYIQSIAGGQVDLPELETIVTGDVQFYSEGISTVDAAPSVINLPKLATYSAVANQRAYLQAVNQGSINVPLLTNLNEVDLIIKSGVIQTAQLESLTNGAIEVSGVTPSFDTLATLTNASVSLDGVSPTFPLITNIDSVEFFLDNAATLTVVGITEITQPAQHKYLARVRDDGSVFSLPDLKTIYAPDTGHQLYVQSWRGGRLDLPELNTIMSGQVRFYSEGVSSVDATPSTVNLPKLESYSARSNSAGIWAVNQGMISVPVLKALDNVDLTIQSGVMQTAQLESFTNANISISGVTPSFDGLATLTNASVSFDGVSPTLPLIKNIDSVEFFLDNGAMLTLAGITEITQPAQHQHLARVRDAGSMFSLPDLKTIYGPDTGHQLYVQSYRGGQIDLPELDTIVSGQVRFYADGVSNVDATPSLVNLSKLESYSARSNTAIIWVVNQGTINVGTLTASTALDNVPIVVDATSAIQTTQLNLLSGSRLSGFGTIDGNVISGGTVRPGSSPGTLTITGDYAQTSTGHLEIEVGGTTPGTQFDVLAVHGDVVLDGAVDVIQTGGFVPAQNAEFAIVTGASVTGTFSSATGLRFGGGAKLQPVYSATDARLQVRPDAGPRVIATDINDSADGTLHFIDVHFDEVLDPASISTDDISVTGPGGSVTLQLPSLTTGNTWRFPVESQQPAGLYTITLGPNVADAVGNLMDQDDDGTNGEDPADQFSTTFALIDDQKPFVVGIEPFDRINTDVNEILVEFNEAMNAASFDAMDVVLTGPSGVVDSSGFSVAADDETNFRITIPAQSTEGHYSVQLGPAITDASGNSMASASTLAFTIDKTGPMATSATPTGTLSAAVNSVVLTFTEEMDVLSVRNNTSLLGPSGGLAVSSVTKLNSFEYRVNFSSQSANGTYELIVGAGALDVAGNGLDQNSDGTPDTFTTSFTLSLPDLQVTSVEPDVSAAVFGDEISLTYDVANSGTSAAIGDWTDRIYLSANQTVGGGDTLLYSRTGTEFSPLAAGTGTYSLNPTVTLPLASHLTAGDYYLIAVADSSSRIAEANNANNTLVSTTTISLTLPPLPDLIVDDIVAPAGANAGQLINLQWTEKNTGAAAATGNRTTRIYLSTDDVIGSDTLVAQFIYGDTIAADASVARSESVSIPPTGLTGDVRFVVEVDSGNSTVEVSEDNNALLDDTIIDLSHVLTLTTPVTAINEAATNGVIRAVVASNEPGPFSVTITSDDPSEIVAPATVEIPAGQFLAIVELSVQNDGVLDGRQTVNIAATASGAAPSTVSIDVIDAQVPALTLDIPVDQLVEGTTVQATVVREFDITGDLVVSLGSTRPAQLTFPSTVTIPNGQNQVSFQVTVTQDDIVENSLSASLTASAPGFSSSTDSVVLRDDDLPVISFNLDSPAIGEADGPLATYGEISRSSISPDPLTFRLHSSDESELFLPTQVTIPANGLAVRFNIGAVNDSDLDGASLVTLTATPVDHQGGPIAEDSVQRTLLVTDDDGPTLSVNVDNNLLREGASTSVTITRNTGTTGSITVDLSVSDTTEASVPATAVIPDGADFVTVTLNAINDSTADGSKFVTVIANAATFSQGQDVLLVTDEDLPDLVVDSITLPSSGETNELVQATYQFKNQGTFGIDGAFTTRAWLSDDALIGDDELIDEFELDGQFAPEQGFPRTFSFFVPETVQQYWIIVETDVHAHISEGHEGNNILISDPLQVVPSYTGTVQTGLTVAASGTLVPLQGVVTDNGGQPVPFAPIAIEVRVNETVRRIAAIADVNGNYSTNFIPLPGEVGNFTVGAIHPGDPQPAVVQDQFTLFGFSAVPDSADVELIEGTTKTLDFDLKNRADVALTNLQAQVLNAPTTFDVTITFPSGNNLGSNGVLPVQVMILSNDAVTAAGELQIRFTANEGGAPVDLPITFTVQPLAPRLVPSVEALRATMVRGEQRVVEFSLTNTGAAAATNVNLQLPVVPFLSTATAALIDTIAPGETVTVSLILHPDDSIPLGPFEGAFVVESDEASVAVPFTLVNVSEATGDLLVQTVNEFFYFDPTQPRLEGALVVVRNAITGEEVASGVTDVNGEVRFSQINEAVYSIEVAAIDHSGFQSNALVYSGEENVVEAFLSRETVQYEWTVTQVEIEDRYEVQVETLFETTVPAPVLAVSPTVIDLAPLRFAGDRLQIDMKLTNHGLIQTEDIRLVFDSHAVYRITPLIERISSLAAKSSVTVPVIIERIVNGPAGPCDLHGAVLWGYNAGPHDVRKTTPITFINVDGTCPVTPPPVPQPFSGGGGGGGGGSSASISFPPRIVPTPPFVEVDVRLQINQDAVMTRTAFEAGLELSNKNDDIAITDLFVSVDVFDMDGNSANDKFQIRVPLLDGIDTVNGTGMLAADSIGSALWLLVPRDTAALLEPVTYFVGGSLEFTEGEQAVDIDFEPVEITVHPDASLDLKYFLQRDVYADDPFTMDVVEPSVPFVLGVQVQNNGAGTADGLSITSGQPKIVENDQGLLIDFDLITTQVAGQNITPAFTADFGDIAPGELQVAEWLLTSTLQGQFTEYEATFEHTSGLGDPRISLINDVQIFELIHRVTATDSGADTVNDFLTNDIPDVLPPGADPRFSHDLPDTVHLSDGRVESVAKMDDASVDSPPSINDLVVQLTIGQTVPGFGYLRTFDPSNGEFRLVRVQRSDGSDLPLHNFWQTDRTFINPDEPPTLEDNLHLFDFASTGSYTLYFETGDHVPPAVVSITEVLPDPTALPVNTLDVTFSEAIIPATFDRGDLTLTRNGGVNLINGAVTIVQQSETVYRIAGLSGLTAPDGDYTLTVDTSGINDLSGNAGVTAASESWLKAEVAPVLTLAGVPSADTNSVVFSVIVNSNQPLDQSSLETSDFALLRDGMNVPLSDLTVTQIGQTSYRVSGFDVFTTMTGNYQLALSASGVQNPTGVDGVGVSTALWNYELTPPTVIAVMPFIKTGSHTIFDSLQFEFDEALATGTFGIDDITLTKDGAPANLISPGTMSLLPITDNVFKLTGLDSALGSDGEYTVNIDLTALTDKAGNAGTGTESLVRRVDESAPSAVVPSVISPDTGFSPTDFVTNSFNLQLSGTGAEPGTTVEFFDNTQNLGLGTADVTAGGEFQHQVSLRGFGNHNITTRVVDAVGNSTESSFDVFVDLASPAVNKIHLGTNLRPGHLTSFEIELTEEIDASSFDHNDLSLIHHTGAAIAVDDRVTVTPVGGTLYRIDGLQELLTTDGNYRFAIDMTGVVDLAGNSGASIFESSFAYIDIDRPDLVPTMFAAISRHVQLGTVDLTFAVRNTGTLDATAFTSHVVWSVNGLLGDDDDVVLADTIAAFSGLAAGSSESRSVTTQIDRAALYAHAVAAAPAGNAVGFDVFETSHLFLVVDAPDEVVEIDESNNRGNGTHIDHDVVTYFPWDINGSGTVTPIEALGASQAINSSNVAYDFDGNGVVTPLEALAVLQRIGYERKDTIAETGVAAFLRSSVVPQPPSEATTPPAAVAYSVEDDENDLFSVSDNENRATEVVAIAPDIDFAATDQEFANATEWISIL